MIGLDTDAIIDVFKKEQKVLKVIENINEPICSTIINYQEIAFGLDLENIKHFSEENFYDAFFEGIFLYLLNKSSSKKASEIFWNLKKEGKTMGNFDCMIAGILLSNGVDKIITRNVKHFKKIKGIKVISY